MRHRGAERVWFYLLREVLDCNCCCCHEKHFSMTVVTCECFTLLDASVVLMRDCSSANFCSKLSATVTSSHKQYTITSST